MQELFDRYDKILSGQIDEIPHLGDDHHKIYAVTNFRGGIGKTTISFNLAYAMAKKYMTLFLDVCPQQNFSSLLLNESDIYQGRTIYDAMMELMMGAAWATNDDQPLALRVQDRNEEFRDGKTCYFIPGSSRLFLFPSQFYSRLNEYLGMTSASGKNEAVKVLLDMLKTIITKQMAETKTEKVLIDTSPFFAGGTHLAWAAADALIIPVRVDEQSIYSLELTLEMLQKEDSDFNVWRRRAGIEQKPTVQAVLMTHCGWNRQADHQIDRASRMYIERAVDIAVKFKDVFSSDAPINHFALLSDFHSSGRISGSRAIPIDKLVEGRQHKIDGRSLEVNSSVNRYKKELKYAFDIINQ
ncbi:CobQ/CobB/MinD/ParA nucleotide binding domain-containing protein [Desulfitobacterium chlororespirans DSM 11544]|uniref:CobQ/CobB/MinD/ParA nucleotide binding domain-containing protein n=1 Tax=Desulfitobacterium chlororespirans DSM 11544 TaxID=1121395 RepID=A0A1M7UPB1_9FIRM|nr:CobQ/CobB/MinD/ParA nucleotide binding domain-containing protein [Desulfitobacterium chlororespirans DSM 11544]